MGYIRGRVERVLHQSGTYHVLSLHVDETDFAVRDPAAKVSGHIVGLPKITGGVTIQFLGDWINHRKYGRQFSPRGWVPWARNTYDIESFLHYCIPGFENLDLAKAVVKLFGEATFDTLTREPERVRDSFPEGSANRDAIERALFQWRRSRALSDLAVFLQDYDLGPEAVSGVFEKFGHDAIDIISKNPYRLIAVESFTFAKADTLAMRLGIAKNDPRRLEGAILWILRGEAQQGHIYVRRGDLPTLLNVMQQEEHIEPFETKDFNGDLMAAVTRLEEQAAVRLDPACGVYLPELFLYERLGAKMLAEFLMPSDIKVDLDLFLSDYQRGNQIDLSDAQRDAVRKLVESRVLVLTGLPGTGKTTVVRTFVRLFKTAGITFTLMAPTGIAAKRLAAVTGEDAGTIHRTFKFNGAEWGYNVANKFPTGAVIVDEMSMVDQELFFRIVSALNPSTMIVLVGDDAQLPSVGPGNVLRELISCPAIPHVRLTQIFRQAQTSDIVFASHKINRGDSPLPEVRRTESEFQFVPLTDEDRIVDFVVEAAAKLKGRNANFQVLSPKYDGAIGVNNLNDKLRDKLNPQTAQREWKAGSFHVREGDRVMVVQNNYQLNVYNGDMAKLVSIGRESLTIRVHGIGPGAVDTHVEIPKDSAPVMLKLAYAITVHKSQGSEFDTILLPIVRTQGRMLQRNLFYTAVTRARKKVWLLGDVQAVHRAIANDKVVQRNTVFGRAVAQEVRKASSGVEGAALEAPNERKREEEPVRPADAGTAG